MLALLLLLSGSAHALQSNQSGPLLELGVGIGAAGGSPTLATQGTMGWWFGRYDSDYALGRFTAVLVTHRVDLAGGSARYTPLLELRRAMDLFVVAPHYLVAVGPVFAEQPGFAARVGGGLKFRRSRRSGFTARLAGGVDVVAGTVRPAVALTVGAGWSSPLPTGASDLR